MVKVLLSVMAEKDSAILLLGVTCALRYGAMQKNVYIELPSQGPKSRGKSLLGRLKKALHRARDALHIWVIW